uniref:arsenate reductase/protein-tyrosine-phosphatase family protein n=1 Tax=Mycolicibacterium bacteremicum TaxID=564198 RepID=UPI0027E2B6C2|nr:low molecular weight phosphatase family protein [Mycolicibacterium bacteremicum]
MCTGNICRSPTAERLAAANSSTVDAAITASSAGTHAVIGHPVHPHADKVLRDLGGDPDGFVARQLTGKIAAGADLVLTMSRAHRDAVLELAPQRLNRTFTLAEASRLVTEMDAQSVRDLALLRPHLSADETLDIPDPIGQSPDVFASVGRQIAELLPPILELCRPR